MNPIYSNETPGTAAADFNVTVFVIEQLLAKIQTLTLVKVISCSNAGGLSPVGTVTVQPMVNQMSGNRQATPHGQLFEVPYFRLQGGTNAVVLDPQEGDIGMCGFCSRDIALVKATKAPANPGSFAMFDWADGLYLGGFLNGTPTQYVQFTDSGINVVGKVVAIQSTAGDTTIDGVAFIPHMHSGVQSGGADTGPVVT